MDRYCRRKYLSDVFSLQYGVGNSRLLFILPTVACAFLGLLSGIRGVIDYPHVQIPRIQLPRRDGFCIHHSAYCRISDIDRKRDEGIADGDAILNTLVYIFRDIVTRNQNRVVIPSDRKGVIVHGCESGDHVHFRRDDNDRDTVGGLIADSG